MMCRDCIKVARYKMDLRDFADVLPPDHPLLTDRRRRIEETAARVGHTWETCPGPPPSAARPE